MLYINSVLQINDVFLGGDKSISHRALMLAAIAEGQCVVSNLSLCDDVMSTVGCLRTLGADIKLQGTTAYVTPIKVPNDDVVLNCGNSGTTARLLCGIVVGLGVKATFVGDESLISRPMRRVTEPLQKLGAKFVFPKGALFQTLGGDLLGKKLVAEVDSAQVKSAVLFAGLFAEGETTYVESKPTRDHTERMLRYVGANICDCTVRRSKIGAFTLSVPNDFSSAAYLLAAALVRGQKATIRNVGVNPLRVVFLRVLANCGAKFIIDNKQTICGEPVADITVLPCTLQKQMYAEPEDVCAAIDEIPLLCAVALASGTGGVFRGVEELRNKESDRIAAICDMAKACGGQACCKDGVLEISSDGKFAAHPTFSYSNDHRIVMSQAVLCVAAKGGSVDNPDCVAISFPGFWRALGVRYGKYAVVGSNIGYSQSPQLMRGFAELRDVATDYRIVDLPSDVSDGRLKEVIDNFDGCNVTVPFKQRVAKIFAAKIPSVNTIGKGIEPSSTDGEGLLRALDKHGFVYKNAKLWVIGAGGAAEACIAALLQKGAYVQVFNRTPEHASNVAQKYGLQNDITQPDGVLSFVPPCLFEGQTELPSSVKYVFVASYDGKSSLLAKAKQRQIPCIDGKDMLYFQGLASFELWQNAMHM